MARRSQNRIRANCLVSTIYGQLPPWSKGGKKRPARSRISQKVYLEPKWLRWILCRTLDIYRKSMINILLDTGLRTAAFSPIRGNGSWWRFVDISSDPEDFMKSWQFCEIAKFLIIMAAVHRLSRPDNFEGSRIREAGGFWISMVQLDSCKSSQIEDLCNWWVLRLLLAAAGAKWVDSRNSTIWSK